MLSQTAIYALRAIGFIAKNGSNQPVLSSQISKQLDIPQNFLSKIMHRLVQEGYLISKRGINGGFILTKEPKEITVKEIVSLFMNVSQFDKCFLGESKCNGSCGLHDQWLPIRKQFRKLLDGNTIERLF